MKQKPRQLHKTSKQEMKKTQKEKKKEKFSRADNL